jgi:hypothetical protein
MAKSSYKGGRCGNKVQVHCSDRVEYTVQLSRDRIKYSSQYGQSKVKFLSKIDCPLSMKAGVDF